MDFAAEALALKTPALAVSFAQQLDLQHAATQFKDQFCYPSHTPAAPPGPLVYFCGNSLGLQPRATRTLLNEELDVWGAKGVNGHFDHPHQRPWVTIDDVVMEQVARVVGAEVEEVCTMNSLTVNLHLMMVSFYTPTPTRFKILMEAKAFPSDYFAISSQVQFHNLDPATTIIQIGPRPGEDTIRTEDILRRIEEEGDEVALVLFSGVQYYTGQLFEIEKITKKAKEKGCIAGWDLAHAAGNALLRLHDWNVDFAVWCSYKYLNSGPGAIAGAFVHRTHHTTTPTRPRFAGWWGTQPTSKFAMDLHFRPIAGANGYRCSNPDVFSTIALKASLDVFGRTSMEVLVGRSRLLTGYLEFLLDRVIPAGAIRVLTPRAPEQRGCQLSVLFLQEGVMKRVFKYLESVGIVCDERKPDVIRLAPAPLYNGFEDVWRVVDGVRAGLANE